MAKLTILFRNAGDRRRGDVLSVREDDVEWGVGARQDHLIAEIPGVASAWSYLADAQMAPRRRRITPAEETERSNVFTAVLGQLTHLPVPERRARARRLVGWDDDFEGDIWNETPYVKPRRYYIDLDKLAQAVQDNVAIRLPLINARNAAHRRMAAGLHAMSAVRTVVARDAVWTTGFSWRDPDDVDPNVYPKGLRRYIKEYIDALAAIAAQEIGPVQIPGTVTDGVGTSSWVIDRGEGVA